MPLWFWIRVWFKWRAWVRNGSWFHFTNPFCVSGPSTDGWWEGLGVGREGCVSRTCEDTTNTPTLSLSLCLSLCLSLSLGRLLSAHTSTQQHRCCCIVWSTKAQISPTGSFYSLAIVSVCLTRPLMNAAVSRRSDTRHRAQKMNHPSIWTIQFKR